MKEEKKDVKLDNINKIDLMYFKRKGLSNTKISKMTGVPTKMVENRIRTQEKYKDYSGIL